MNFKRILQMLFLLVVFIIPSYVKAYSNKVILGGENIGIRVDNKYITVVGFYEVEGKYIAKESGLEVGDKIVEVNGVKLSNIDDMVEAIKDTEVTMTILRNDKKKNIDFDLYEDDNGVIKTGIYVKDKITGIGTLTYIDPNSKVFGALGHEIDESTTGEKVEIKSGEIFYSNITGITRSSGGNPGEKNATFDIDNVYGSIKENESSGIFGTYEKEIDNSKLIEVGTKEEIKLGKAKMLTVLSGDTVEEFTINITSIDKNNNIKNILFEITDSKLIKETNGVVSGMSGSPIIQNNKLVAAVTHVVVSDPIKGYGILIETMLEEGDKSKE
ncbi:MAG: SpoIVB peptidase S55 domain-containing protein [Bacilli bacterium]